ncbi:hypothetical protein DL93DRAFT_2164662 [Clavulina sp. PMI_390]|nr:hypothetical protein DL93DRAFT_2164662 [Clavulina sp. PMI_390]
MHQLQDGSVVTGLPLLSIPSDLSTPPGPANGPAACVEGHSLSCGHIKLNPDGSIERYHYRLVACGDMQGPTEGSNFAPVTCLAVRTVLAVGASEDMHIHSMDVSVAQ